MLGSQAQIFGMGAVAVHFLLLTPSGSRHSGRALALGVCEERPPTPVGRGKLGLGWPRAVGCDPAGAAAAASALWGLSPRLWELRSRLCWDVQTSQMTRVLPVLRHCSDSDRAGPCRKPLDPILLPSCECSSGSYTFHMELGPRVPIPPCTQWEVLRRSDSLQ